jgi:putative transcriptional regulator
MTDKHTLLGSELIAAMNEVKSHIKGKTTLPSRTVNIPDTIDIKSLRKKRGLNQKEFAEHYGFTLSSVKDWEQGRRKPERAARILLAIIEKDPQIVEKILNQKSG